jgi:hypothetical protein
MYSPATLTVRVDKEIDPLAHKEPALIEANLQDDHLALLTSDGKRISHSASNLPKKTMQSLRLL